MALKEIPVWYAKVDGAHFFTSNDPLAAGLCAASKNFDVAMSEAVMQLEYLLEKKLGHAVKCIPPKKKTKAAVKESKPFTGIADIHPGFIANWKAQQNFAACQ